MKQAREEEKNLWLMLAGTGYFGFSIRLLNEPNPDENNHRCNKHCAAGNKLVNTINDKEEHQVEKCTHKHKIFFFVKPLLDATNRMH